MPTETRRLLRRYLWLLVPKLVAALVAIGSVSLWQMGVMKPGGAYMSTCIALMFVMGMNRVESIRAEILEAIAAKRAGEQA